jgi:hypothetical protein
MNKVIYLILILSSSLYAQSKVGSSAAAFLGSGVGSRAIGMGGAFSAVGGDASILYWNPGAMANIKKSEVLLSKANWLVESDLNYIASIVKLEKGRSLGGYLMQLDYGKEEITDLNNQNGTGQYWTAMDYVLGLGLGSKLSDRFSVGVIGKFISQRIHYTSASTFALDLGLHYKTKNDKVRIGMSIANFGPDMTMDGKDLFKKIDIDPDNSGHNESLVAKLKTDPWPLPLFFRVGTAIEIINTDLLICTLAVDTFIPSDDVEIINTGVEFTIFQRSNVQFGYKGLGNSSSEEGFTFGAGTMFYAGGFDVRLDYSLRTFGLFGNISNLSLSFIF